MRTGFLLLFSLLGLFGCGESATRSLPFQGGSEADFAKLPPGDLGSSGSWTGWRGPHRDAISAETGLLDSWPDAGPSVKWQADAMGAGYSSLSIESGRIFTMGQQDGTSYVLALNFANGRRLWARRVGFGDPNCTPTIDGDRVYALSREGDLVCMNVADGKVAWTKGLPRDFGGRMMSIWGFSESPLIDGDRVICTPGAKDAMLVALDKKTGATVWKSKVPDLSGPAGKAPQVLGPAGVDGAGYASVVISHGGGVKQYVQLVGRGVISVRADDGRFLWSYNRVANQTANIPTPLVKDDYVFASSGYGAGAALLQLSKSGDGVAAKEVYFLNGGKFQNHHGGMVLLGDYVYCGNGHNSGFPVCLELKTGKIAWKGGRGPGEGSAAVLEADGHLYFRYENGIVALIEATPKKYVLRGKFETEPKNGTAWAHPVIVDRQLFLRNGRYLVCYDIARPGSSKPEGVKQAALNTTDTK